LKKQKIKESEADLKNPERRIFYLDRAANRAKNTEFKKLWLDKKEQLLKKYNI
jgi:DNA repair protein RadC